MIGVDDEPVSTGDVMDIIRSNRYRKEAVSIYDKKTFI